MKKSGRTMFDKYKNIIMFISKVYGCIPSKIRKKLLAMHRNTNGNIGIVIRYALLKSIAKECGDNVSIFPGVFLNNPENMTFGNNVSIHPMCYIECGLNGEILIGNDVSIAHGVTIMATSHLYGDKDIPIKYQGIDSKNVTICDNVWIGAKASILYGNTIQSGVVIGANSVITKDISSNSVVVGNPARVIKER